MGYKIVHALTEKQIVELHGLYQKEWWSETRDLPDVRRMVEHSDFLFGVVDDFDDRLVGFCRVITDHVFRGTLYDVIVAKDKRGEQIGKLLMDAVAVHPVISNVEVINLFCKPDMCGFYEKWGFGADSSGTQPMTREVVI